MTTTSYSWILLSILPVMAVGALAYWWWRRSHGAVPREVETRRQLVIVVVCGLALGSMMVLSALLRESLAAPAVSWYFGGAVAFLLFALTEYGRRTVPAAAA